MNLGLLRRLTTGLSSSESSLSLPGPGSSPSSAFAAYLLLMNTQTSVNICCGALSDAKCQEQTSTLIYLLRTQQLLHELSNGPKSSASNVRWHYLLLLAMIRFRLASSCFCFCCRIISAWKPAVCRQACVVVPRATKNTRIVGHTF